MLPLSSSRLILRDFTAKDFEAVHKYTSSPEVTKHIPWGPFTEEETKISIQMKIDGQIKHPRKNYELVVILKDQLTLIGECYLSSRNTQPREVEVGYVLHNDYWGLGIATEIVSTLVRFGFEELKLHRIFGTCGPENPASSRVLEKNGFQLEGHFREHKLVRGKWRDSLYYAILSHDWSR